MLTTSNRRYFDPQRRLLGGRMVDLEGGVVDLEPFSEQALKVTAQLVAVLAGRHGDVGRQRGKAGSDFPHVEVVDFDHPWLGGERFADLLWL